MAKEVGPKEAQLRAFRLARQGVVEKPVAPEPPKKKAKIGQRAKKP